MSRRRLPLVLLAVLLPRFAPADVIATSFRSASTATFDLVTADRGYSFSTGNTIVLTGLYGVTNATLTSNGASFGSVSYSATSVTFTATRFAYDASQSPVDVALFTVNSSTPTNAVIRYSLQETNQTTDDTVKDSATPEPSSLFLLLPGTTGMVLLLRRRQQPGAPRQ